MKVRPNKERKSMKRNNWKSYPQNNWESYPHKDYPFWLYTPEEGMVFFKTEEATRPVRGGGN